MTMCIEVSGGGLYLPKIKRVVILTAPYPTAPSKLVFCPDNWFLQMGNVVIKVI